MSDKEMQEKVSRITKRSKKIVDELLSVMNANNNLKIKPKLDEFSEEITVFCSSIIEFIDLAAFSIMRLGPDCVDEKLIGKVIFSKLIETAKESIRMIEEVEKMESDFMETTKETSVIH